MQAYYKWRTKAKAFVHTFIVLARGASLPLDPLMPVGNGENMRAAYALSQRVLCPHAF